MSPPRSAHPSGETREGPARGARYGKREPRAGARDHAAEMRDAKPSRRAGNRPPDPGTRRAKEAKAAPRHQRSALRSDPVQVPLRRFLYRRDPA